jgi:hypothetical protein
VYARAIIGATETDWSIAATDGAASSYRLLCVTDFKARVSDRITQAGYDPDGAGDAPYLGLRIAAGDGDAQNEFRGFATYDNTCAVKPYIVIGFVSPPVPKKLPIYL